MSWKAHDVPGDGNCFYTCIAAAVQSDKELAATFQLNGLSRAQAARRFRWGVARAIQRSTTVQLWLGELVLLALEVPQVVDEHPFLKDLGKDDSISDRIARSNVWASDFEINVVREILKTRAVALFIVQDRDRETARGSTKLEEELDKTIDSHLTRERGKPIHLSVPQCIVLLRLTSLEHFMYLALDCKPVMFIADLKDHLQQYVESSSDESD